MYGVVREGFADELRAFGDTSRGTVRFPLDRPMPQDLVRRLVVARVAQREAAS